MESNPVWDELKTCRGRKKLILLSFHLSPRSCVSIRLEVSNISKTMVQPVFKNPLALQLILNYILGICILWFVGIFPKKMLRYYVSNLAVICYWGYSLLWIVRPRSSLWFLELPDLFCLTLMMVISMRWDHVFEQRSPTNGFTVHAPCDRYISMESQGGLMLAREYSWFSEHWFSSSSWSSTAAAAPTKIRPFGPLLYMSPC